MSAPLHVSELRYLSAATHYHGRGTTNSCVQRSVALALDMRQGILTFGTFRAATDAEVEADPRSSREPFIHCWVEVGEAVLAPTTLERTGGVLVPFRRAHYYEINEAKDVRHVPRPAFDDIVRKHRLFAALRHMLPRFGSGKVTEDLLAAAGVRYRVGGENRSLLPLED